VGTLIASCGGGGGQAADSPAQSAAPTPPGRLVISEIENLGPFQNNADVSGQSGMTILDYSGFCYCPDVDALLLFGGGHAATPGDNVMRFSLATKVWTSDYAPTLTHTIANLVQPGLFWKGVNPPLRPIARHTYTALTWHAMLKRMLCYEGNGGLPNGLPNDVNAALDAQPAYACAYDPVAKTWDDHGFAVPATGSTCFDPVSGLLVWTRYDGFAFYDPVARKRVVLRPWTLATDTDNLVYYPPDDKFYLILSSSIPAGGPKVIELTFDRTGLVLTPAQLECNWRPSPVHETRYVFDTASQRIVGGLSNGVIYGFRPLGNGKGEWMQQAGPPGSTLFFHHAYDVARNRHYILNETKTLYAFTWDPAAATIPVNPFGTRATITISGTRYPTLQAAADVGGDIVIGAGTLVGDAAIITKRTSITGGTIISPGIQGKGILITQADTTVTSTDISGAVVPDGNGAAIRHEAGNISLKSCKIHDNENGFLGGSAAVTVTIHDCDVYHNGSGDGQTHGLYIGSVNTANVSNSRFWQNRIGHHVKSRAKVTNVTNCILGKDMLGTESYNVDVPQGGNVVISECYLRQGPNTDNNVMVNYGGEPAPYSGGSLKVSGCTMESQGVSNAVGIRVNSNVDVLLEVTNCRFIGVEIPVQASRYTMVGCTKDGAPIPDKLT
jgi:hypothetical protein